MTPDNPFRPSFGTSPPLLVGRDQVVLAWEDALDAGPGAPRRATLYTGVRGVGKTVMLNAAEDQARRRGWVVISETATDGLVQRLVDEGIPEVTRQLQLPAVERRISGVTLPMSLGGLDFDVHRHPAASGLRTQLNAVTDHLSPLGTGLLITLDEVHAASRPDIRLLATVIQHCFREERPVAFAAAGLPAAVDDLLRDRVLTFLRRADRQVLGPIASVEVEDALRGPIEDRGRSIDDTALVEAAEATGGYPFLIQLMGYWIWRADASRPVIDRGQVQSGLVAARRRVSALVLEPALADTSARDRTFLRAMAQDDGPSRMADLAARLGVDANYASQYRLRLIAAGMIRATSHGYVDFTLPYLREHLRDQA